MGRVFTGLGLLVAIVAIIGLGFTSWLSDPVRVEAERNYRTQRDAIDLAAHAAAKQRDIEYWQSVQPWLIASTIALALCAAGGLGLAALSFGLGKWDSRQRNKPVTYPDARGLLPVSEAVRDAAALAALNAYHMTQLENAKRPVFSGGARSERISISNGHAAPQLPNRPAVELPAPATAPMLPGPTSLSSVLTWKPSLDRLLIGLDQYGQPLTTSASGLCHVAITGATGGGKSNLLRLLLAQLAAAGARLVICDPHWTPLDRSDPVSGDWRGIEQRLYRPPAVSPVEIEDMLAYVDDELTHRLGLRRAGQELPPPLFLALDELPSINAQVEGAADVLGRIVREGRKLEIFTVSSAQDFLVKTIGGSSAARDNFRTCYYVGGDRKSAAALLDVRERDIDDSMLGKGLVMLRNQSAARTATLARVPLVGNDDLARLLPAPASLPRLAAPISNFGAPSEVAEVGEVARSGRVLTFPSVQNEAREVAEVGEVARSGEVDDRDARAIDLMRGTEGNPPMSMTSAIATVFGVKGGEAFQRHAARLRARMLNGPTGTEGD